MIRRLVPALMFLISTPAWAQYCVVERSGAVHSVISAATLAGQVLDLSDYTPAREGRLWFHATGFAADGFTIELTLGGPGAVQVELADTSDGLPVIQGPSAPTRPADTMPSAGATWDGTVVRNRITLSQAQP